jgi:hypothetical protein
MSSVLRYTKEQNNINRQFKVCPYYTSGSNYFFTVNNGSLYRAEADLQGVEYVIARDMGTQMVINTIDPGLINYWTNLYAENPEPYYDFTNTTVVRPGIARKFQVLSVVRNSDNVGSNGNENAYSTDNNLFNIDGTDFTVNNLLIVGHAGTTVNNSSNQNLPFGTFWAMNDPVVIRYNFSEVTVQRAIKNNITETTLF